MRTEKFSCVRRSAPTWDASCAGTRRIEHGIVPVTGRDSNLTERSTPGRQNRRLKTYNGRDALRAFPDLAYGLRRRESQFYRSRVGEIREHAQRVPTGINPSAPQTAVRGC